LVAAGGRAVMSTIESDGDVVGMCDNDDGDEEEEEEVKDVVVVGN
jgi:putative hemolysin